MIRRIGLFILACLAASTVAMAQPPAAVPGSDISPDQKVRLRTIMDEGKRDNDAMLQQLRRARRELFKVFGRYDMDMRRANGLMRQINDIQNSLMQRHLRTQLEVRRIISKPQFEELKKFMHENRSNPNDHGGPRAWNDHGVPRPGPGNPGGDRSRK